MHIGTSTSFLTSSKYSWVPESKEVLSPVVPLFETQYTKPFAPLVIAAILSLDVLATSGIK
jgi:hypothetical protein